MINYEMDQETDYADLPQITERDVRQAIETAQAYLASRAGDSPGTQSSMSTWAVCVLQAAAGYYLAGQATDCQECNTRWFSQVRRAAHQARAQERWRRCAAIAQDLDLQDPPATYQPNHPRLSAGQPATERAQLWHAHRIALLIRADMAEDDLIHTHTADLLPIGAQESAR